MTSSTGFQVRNVRLQVFGLNELLETIVAFDSVTLLLVDIAQDYAREAIAFHSFQTREGDRSKAAVQEG